MSDRRHGERQRSRVVFLAAAGMLLGTGLPGPAVFAQAGSSWVDPPPLESTPTQPAPQPTPEVRAPAAPRTSTPRVTEPSPALNDPPPLERTTSQPAPQPTPEVRAPAAPRTSTPRVTEPSPALNPEPVRPRISRPRAVEPPVFEPEPTRRPRLSRPKPQREPGPALARRAPSPVEEIEEVDEVAPAPRLARKHAVGPIPRPSFNCRYAKIAVEHAICADPVLAAKDRRMALLYEQAGGSRYRPVDPSQWSWLAARNRCGRARGPALEGCLHRAYDDRMAELSLR
jgi:hypothetical protein